LRDRRRAGLRVSRTVRRSFSVQLRGAIAFSAQSAAAVCLTVACNSSAQPEALGDKVRRDCISLVDTVRATEKEPAVLRSTLDKELRKRKVDITALVEPEKPSFSAYHKPPATKPPPRAVRDLAAEFSAAETTKIEAWLAEVEASMAADKGGGGAYGAALRKYDADMKAYEQAWKDLKGRGEYEAAWNAARAIDRDDSIRECIVKRAERERAR